MTAAAPLVLIPGMLCTGRLFGPMLRVIEQRGYAGPAEVVVCADDSVEMVARTVLATTDQPPVLVGHSLGATVAMAAARLYPDRVAGIVTLCANPRPPRSAQHALWASLRRRAEAAGTPSVVAEETIDTWLGAAEDTSSRRALCRDMVAETGLDRFLAQLSAQHHRIDERPSLRASNVPMLAVSAAADQLIGADAAAEAALSRRTRALRLPQAGHLAPLTAPGPVADALVHWLEDPDGPHSPHRSTAPHVGAAEGSTP